MGTRAKPGNQLVHYICIHLLDPHWTMPRQAVISAQQHKLQCISDSLIISKTNITVKRHIITSNYVTSIQHAAVLLYCIIYMAGIAFILLYLYPLVIPTLEYASAVCDLYTRSTQTVSLIISKTNSHHDR